MKSSGILLSENVGYLAIFPGFTQTPFPSFLSPQTSMDLAAWLSRFFSYISFLQDYFHSMVLSQFWSLAPFCPLL